MRLGASALLVAHLSAAGQEAATLACAALARLAAGPAGRAALADAGGVGTLAAALRGPAAPHAAVCLEVGAPGSKEVACNQAGRARDQAAYQGTESCAAQPGRLRSRLPAWPGMRQRRGVCVGVLVTHWPPSCCMRRTRAETVRQSSTATVSTHDCASVGVNGSGGAAGATFGSGTKHGVGLQAPALPRSAPDIRPWRLQAISVRPGGAAALLTPADGVVAALAVCISQSIAAPDGSAGLPPQTWLRRQPAHVRSLATAHTAEYWQMSAVLCPPSGVQGGVSAPSACEL